MQVELDKGSSLEDIRKKITKGEVQTNVSKQPPQNTSFNTNRVQRKNRDIMSLLTKFETNPTKENISRSPEVLSAVKRFSVDKEAQIDGPVMNKKIFKLGDKELLVCL